MCQVGAIIWNCTNTEAAQRIFEQRDRYGAKQTTHDRGKEKDLLLQAGIGGWTSKPFRRRK